MDTTRKIRNALFSQPDEMQTAYNAFAIAVKNFTADPTPENRAVMDTAQQVVYDLEDKYRDGRRLKLEHARKHAPTWKQA